ncbi:hypothetical protein VDGD_07288 [Verticillium dahliae]|nr:hypothetical protein VDGD_07288 [Verticillium dahliae]
MDPLGSSLLYRKNGRAQACEPCRKRKVGCDHGQPVCSRCRKGKNPEACEYIVESPTRKRSRETSSPPPAASSVKVHRTSQAEPRSSRLPSPNSTSSVAVITRPVSAPKDAVAVYGFQTPDNASPHPVNTAPGFLGFTSFSGIYDEARSNLSLLHPQTVTVSLDFEARKDPKDARRSQMLTPAVLETCLAVLRHIPDEKRGRSLFRAHYNLCDGWTQPVALKSLEALYKVYGDYFDESRDDVKLTKLAHIICENTRRPFSENERDPVEWAAQFSGHNTRWETLGVLFTYWRMGAIVHDYTQQPFGPVGSMSCGFTRKHEMHQQCLKNCAELARAHSESGNTMLLYVFFKRMILESVSAGDASEFRFFHPGFPFRESTDVTLQACPAGNTTPRASRS